MATCCLPARPGSFTKKRVTHGTENIPHAHGPRRPRHLYPRAPMLHQPRHSGPSEDEQFAIQKGKIDGDKITLLVDHDGHTMTFNLVLAADRITGDAQMSRDGQTMKARIDVSRAK